MTNETIYYDWIMKHTGKPYRWAGDDAIAGYDCSGFAIDFARMTGVIRDKNFDTTAKNLYNMYPKITTNLIKFGDYVYYGSADNITHVAVVLNKFLMFEFGGGGSTTKTIEDAIKQNAVGRVRPINARKDLVGFNRPPHDWSS